MDESLIKEFKKTIGGKILLKERMSSHTSFRIGGPVDIWVEPKDTSKLKKVILFARAYRIPFFIVGTGSNLLVKDRGVEGIAIHLGSPFFKKVSIRGTSVSAGAGYNIWRLVRFCCNKGLGGFESLIGIPGTVGGAVYMNAGGAANPIYKNIGDFVTSLKAMDYDGNIKKLKREDLKFGYRRSNLDSYIILGAMFKLEKGDKATLNSSCSKFLNIKRQKQALDVRSAGCVFKNPDNFQFTCGQMIDMLGLKSTKIGGAEISEKHANFIVNRSSATSEDVMKLIEFVKGKVRENYNIGLELEIKVL